MTTGMTFTFAGKKFVQPKLLEVEAGQYCGKQQKRVFLKYINNKRRTTENIGFFLMRMVISEQDDRQSKRRLVPSLPLSSTLITNSGTPDAPSWRSWSSANYLAKPKLVQDLLLHLDSDKFIGPNGFHPRVFRGLDNAIERDLDIEISLIFFSRILRIWSDIS